MRGAAAVHHAGTSSCESTLILPASKIRQWKLHCHLLPAGGREWLNVDFRGEGFEKLATGGQARTCTRWTGWVAKTACCSLFQLVEIMQLDFLQPYPSYQQGWHRYRAARHSSSLFAGMPDESTLDCL